MENWLAIEADFQREYGIDLMQSFYNLTWRKFTVLLNGLSANSIWFNIVSNAKEIIVDPEEAEKAVDNVWAD